MTPLPQRSGPSGSARRRTSAGAMRLMTDLFITAVSLPRRVGVGQILSEGVGPPAERRPPLELPAVVSEDRVPGARGRAPEVLRPDRLQARAPESGVLHHPRGQAV